MKRSCWWPLCDSETASTVSVSGSEKCILIFKKYLILLTFIPQILFFCLNKRIIGYTLKIIICSCETHSIIVVRSLKDICQCSPDYSFNSPEDLLSRMFFHAFSYLQRWLAVDADLENYCSEFFSCNWKFWYQTWADSPSQTNTASFFVLK